MLAGVALGLVAMTASAHAPPLGARVLPAEPGADEVIVTNRGLIFREPATGEARLLCNEALRINTSELPNVARLGDGGLLVATSSGLRLSRDQGCSWSDVGQMEATNTPALAADPNDRDTVIVATYDSDVPGLRITRDSGASWTLLYPTREGDYVHSLLVAPAGAVTPDATTLYATIATYAPGEAPAHALLRTRDGGASWQRIELPLTEKDYLARAAAVSPDDPATLVLYTVANSPGLDASRLLVSHDAGDTFEVVLERPEIRGAGYGDGTLWVAARDGLYRASAELTSFEQTSPASELGCVLEREGALYVCGHYAGLAAETSGIGISADGGHTFERWLDFGSVDRAVECPAASLTASVCAQPWLDWQAEMSGALPAPPAYGPVGAAGTNSEGTPPVSAPRAPESDPAEPALDAELGSDAGMGAACALREPRPGAHGGRAGALAWTSVIAALAWGRRRRSRKSLSASRREPLE